MVNELVQSIMVTNLLMKFRINPVKIIQEKQKAFSQNNTDMSPFSKATQKHVNISWMLNQNVIVYLLPRYFEQHQ